MKLDCETEAREGGSKRRVGDGKDMGILECGWGGCRGEEGKS